MTADQSPGATGAEAVRAEVDRAEVDRAGPGDSEAADLVAQIRQLAGSDPADVQRVIGDVLAALDRVTSGRLPELPPEGRPVSGGTEGGRTGDPG